MVVKYSWCSFVKSLSFLRPRIVVLNKKLTTSNWLKIPIDNLNFFSHTVLDHFPVYRKKAFMNAHAVTKKLANLATSDPLWMATGPCVVVVTFPSGHRFPSQQLIRQKLYASSLTPYFSAKWPVHLFFKHSYCEAQPLWKPVTFCLSMWTYTWTVMLRQRSVSLGQGVFFWKSMQSFMESIDVHWKHSREAAVEKYGVINIWFLNTCRSTLKQRSKENKEIYHAGQAGINTRQGLKNRFHASDGWNKDRPPSPEKTAYQHLIQNLWPRFQFVFPAVNGLKHSKWNFYRFR